MTLEVGQFSGATRSTNARPVGLEGYSPPSRQEVHEPHRDRDAARNPRSDPRREVS
jgi:hypothetical protein